MVHALIDRHQDDLKLAPLRRVQIVCENHLPRRSVELALRPPTRQRYEEFVQSIRGGKHALLSLPGAQAALAAIDFEMQAHRDTIFAVMMELWKVSPEEQKDSRRGPPTPPPVDTSGASAFDRCMQAAGNRRDAGQAKCHSIPLGDQSRANCNAAYPLDIAHCLP